MEIIDLVGFAATVFGTAAFFPQVVKMFKTNQIRDLSLGMLILMVSGSLLWAIYGVVIVSMPIIAANIMSIAFQIYLLVKKMDEPLRYLQITH
jgi:MtN3 and saliva related transmembrane protein